MWMLSSMLLLQKTAGHGEQPTINMRGKEFTEVWWMSILDHMVWVILELFFLETSIPLLQLCWSFFCNMGTQDSFHPQSGHHLSRGFGFTHSALVYVTKCQTPERSSNELLNWINHQWIAELIMQTLVFLINIICVLSLGTCFTGSCNWKMVFAFAGFEIN